MIEQQDSMIEQKDTVIEQQDSMIEQKDNMIELKDKMIGLKDTMIKQKDTALYEIVQKMLRRNMSFQMIGEVTGLSYDEIRQIKDDAAG